MKACLTLITALMLSTAFAQTPPSTDKEVMQKSQKGTGIESKNTGTATDPKGSSMSSTETPEDSARAAGNSNEDTMKTDCSNLSGKAQKNCMKSLKKSR